MLNTNLVRSKAISKCFPRATSIFEISQNPENRFETATMRIGINDFLKLGSNIDVVTNNIINNSHECKNYGTENIFVLGLTINNPAF